MEDSKLDSIPDEFDWNQENMTTIMTSPASPGSPRAYNNQTLFEASKRLNGMEQNPKMIDDITKDDIGFQYRVFQRFSE